MTLHGVLAPIPTPFRNEAIDLDALASNVTRWMDGELTGIVVLGTNGEAAHLDDDEADRVVARTREAMPAGRTLVAGTARESTRATIAATRRAGGLGVDAVLVRTPSFFKALVTPDGLIDHFRAVADASPVPVLLYNFPQVTGVNLSADLVARLAEHPNITGIKESSGNVLQVSQLVLATDAEFQVVVGSAQTFYASLCVGAVGGVLALACVQPALCGRLRQLVVDKRFDEALELQQQLIPIAELVTTRYGVPGLKAAMDLVGLSGGEPRLPLRPCAADAVDEIRGALAALPAPSEVAHSL
ncbi:MAG: dihydrodipicolinate synthase family protein [Vicinamibacterales bacterium]|jgi:4-hydroxy-2-oxoglutarate aldolase|nr:dihydrodipicolinate synthase family protein [Acidobacteriota bacterium]MDP7294637.1 dihydrodipicolinate synthase family protein [Vicinamibacterales bacterium]MDP7472555.1 dihydrodipicolinate synthase family protein [Vicinamibacterales bacterium]MDP7670632.1 dihydrodipicolinate synthase family protein [Vicinamibacterales bacterium]HJO39085.1 dihydrodipicolinate synthase family protein [Vicinamibacterales bacterium]